MNEARKAESAPAAGLVKFLACVATHPATLALICALANPGTAIAATFDVTGRIAVVRPNARTPDCSNAVIWLRQDDQPAQNQDAPGAVRRQYVMRQQHKHFDPPVLVIPAGSVVAFPNLDPFFHNVFSLYDGKRFDLGLYEAGASRSVTFDHPGVCYVFCNIHPEMAAAIIVVDTHWYAVSNRAGEYRMSSVPEGRYLMWVWHQRAKPAPPDAFPIPVTIGAGHVELPAVRLIDTGALIIPHTNKYGRGYESQPSPPGIYK